MNTSDVKLVEDPTGLEDVVRSVRGLARMTRGLAESAGGVAERELAMAITISERLRDSVVSTDTLRRARGEELPARLRQDAHRALDLFADAATVAYRTGIDFLEALTDERRPKLAEPAAGQG